MVPIFLVTGPPAAGKSTFCELLLNRFERGLHCPVDDLRLWVSSGLSDAVPWTDETERQFQLAEEAAFDVAVRYQDAGFAVAIDHCRNLPRLDELCRGRLGWRRHVKVCLLPELDVNLARNRARTNKAFDPLILEDTIRFVHGRMRSETAAGWQFLDNTRLSPEESVSEFMAWHRLP